MWIAWDPPRKKGCKKTHEHLFVQKKHVRRKQEPEAALPQGLVGGGGEREGLAPGWRPREQRWSALGAPSANSLTLRTIAIVHIPSRLQKANRQ